MRPIRVRSLMIAMALLAVDMALIIYLHRYEEVDVIRRFVLTSTVPIVLALNVGLLRSFATRGRVRAFWVGFLLCGTMTMAATTYAASTPPAWGPSAMGKPNKVREESRMWALNNSYLLLAGDCLKAFGFDLWSIGPSNPPRIAYSAIVGTIQFVPQLIFALAGGLVARSMIRRPRTIALDLEKPEA